MNVTIKCELCGEMQFDMPEERATQLIGQACCWASELQCEPALYEDAEPAEDNNEEDYEPEPVKPSGKVERMFGDIRSRIPISSVMPEMQKAETDEYYTGFLLIQCDDCGTTKGFCTKSHMRSFICDCGCRTVLKNMRPMYLNCKKCGDRFKYMTNIEDDYFMYSCKHCGAPVDMEITKNGKAFVNV